MPSQKFAELLDRLEIGSGDTVYLHTSFSRMAYLELSGEQFLQELTRRLGNEGTLVLPSFAWNLDPSERPWNGYRQYFEKRPVFDVLHTEANIGYLPELFRHTAGTRRSLSYFWSVAAVGKYAGDITNAQETVEDPYGPGSSFDILRLMDAKILGLGVSLNTTSLALVADYALRNEYGFAIMTDNPELGIVQDGERRFETKCRWLLPDVVRWIEPATLLSASAVPIIRADHHQVINFSYRYPDYHREALRLGKDALKHNRPVPWLSRFVEQTSRSYANTNA